MKRTRALQPKEQHMFFIFFFPFLDSLEEEIEYIYENFLTEGLEDTGKGCPMEKLFSMESF